ncbi:hypothetical protein [Streptomyces luteogriseus]|uniref:hypothetical protein n=1 Tax=Streptomyces luteogriseus TaxID=68233 RepID=UPI0037A13BA7
MPRMGRPRTAREYVRQGEEYCRFKVWDEDSERVVPCGGEVPEGELTSLALNTRSATFLALCKKHRRALAESVEEWMSAAVGQGTVSSTRVELHQGQLVSHTRLREALMQRNLAGKNGPLTDEQELVGVELLYGEDVREALEHRKSST